MTNHKKENISEGILYTGIGLMCLGYLVMCAELISEHFIGPIGLGWPMAICGVLMTMGSLAYQAFKGWL
jgi:hypothetical protein